MDVGQVGEKEIKEITTLGNAWMMGLFLKCSGGTAWSNMEKLETWRLGSKIGLHPTGDEGL